MYIYIYVYTYIYTHTYIIYIHRYVCVCIGGGVCTCMCIHTSVSMYMREQKLCVNGVHLCMFILVHRRREWQNVLTQKKLEGTTRVDLSWQWGKGHVDEYTIDLTLMKQNNLRSGKERAIRLVFLNTD